MGSRGLRRGRIPRMRARLVCLIVATTFIGFAVGSPAGASGAHARTVVRVVTPVTATGLAPGYAVTERVHGECLGPASDVIAGQVYRCFYADVVTDPCWRDPRFVGRDHALCLATPWQRSLTQIVLSAPLEQGGEASTLDPGYPWGITLADGRRCLAAQGAHDHITDPKQGER
ncbi:MAG: hypothetical protein QOE64_1614, partial [Frankiales bacterium]|nr:hypothetical protein [Frankiales bacterium]